MSIGQIDDGAAVVWLESAFVGASEYPDTVVLLGARPNHAAITHADCHTLTQDLQSKFVWNSFRRHVGKKSGVGGLRFQPDLAWFPLYLNW